MHKVSEILIWIVRYFLQQNKHNVFEKRGKEPTTCGRGRISTCPIGIKYCKINRSQSSLWALPIWDEKNLRRICQNCSGLCRAVNTWLPVLARHVLFLSKIQTGSVQKLWLFYETQNIWGEFDQEANELNWTKQCLAAANRAAKWLERGFAWLVPAATPWQLLVQNKPRKKTILAAANWINQNLHLI